MINKLKQQIKDCIKQLDIIDNQKVSCNKCNGTGLIEAELKLLNKVKFSCDCQILNNVYRFEIEDRLKKSERIISEIKKDIPEDYQYNCFFENIDSRIKDFLNSNKLFLFLHGGTGTGKTYALHGIMINQIEGQTNIYNRLTRIKEVDFNYQTEFRKNIAIDDVGISNNINRISNLTDLYYELIDYKREAKQQLILTSNITLPAWFEQLSKINYNNYLRIESRMSNATQVIELIGEDRRKKLINL